MDQDLEGPLMADNLADPYNRRRVLTIDDLPDDDLLAIFDFYVFKYQYLDFYQLNVYDIQRKIESWQSLVHVCQRWRCIVFGAPRRLNLQICYKPGLSARKTLDVWPTLPLIINGYVLLKTVDNVVAILDHSDRIGHISLVCDHGRPVIEKLCTAMQVPFPKLETLYLSYRNSSYRPVLPDSFLGRSAPRLRYLTLTLLPFPGLPKLLLSAAHLVHLRLHYIPDSGYISPEAMATCLSMLTNLELLHLVFVSHQSHPDLKSRRPFPPTRSVLPTLTKFFFKGPNEYLQEFVARIDAPQLSSTTFFEDIDFDTPEFHQFISCTPTLGAYDEALLIFYSRSALVKLRQSHPEPSGHRMVQVKIVGEMSNRLLSTLAQICTLSLHLLLTMENLYIGGNQDSLFVWRGDPKDTKWLDLLLPFTTVKNLYLSEPFSPSIARALHELTGGRTTEVLPALRNVLLEGFQPSELVREGIAQFISARQLTSHHVAISVWNRDFVLDESESLEDGDW